MKQRAITWTGKLQGAVLKIAAEPPPAAAPSVKERAQEAWAYCHPFMRFHADGSITGPKLEPWRVEIIQCLRTRLTPGEHESHAAFLAAFNEAWEAGEEV